MRAAIEAERTKFDAQLASPPSNSIDHAGLYGQLGISYHRYDLRDSARACYENAVQLAPSDYRWSYYLGRIYEGLGNLDKARAAFERSHEVEAEYLPTMIQLGDVYLDQGATDRAEAVLSKALQIDPNCAAAIFGLGRVAASREQWSLAVQRYEQTLKLAPGADIVCYPLGLAYRYLGNKERARFYMEQRGMNKVHVDDPLKQVLDRESVGWRRFQNQGTTLVQRGNLLDAERTFNKAIAAAPLADRHLPLGNRGACRVMLAEFLRPKSEDTYWRKLREAREDLEKAVELDPSRPRPHYNLGRILAMFGDDAGAVKEYTKSLEIDDDQYESHMNLGNALRRLGRFEEAYKHYQRVIELLPVDESSRLAAALSLIRLHRYREAIDALEEGVRVVPESTRLRSTLARLLATQPRKIPDDPVRAGNLLEEITQIQKKKGNETVEMKHVLTRGMALSQVGRFDAAINLFDRCLDAAKKVGREDIIQRIESYIRLAKDKKPVTEPWPDDHPTLSPAPLS